MSTKNYESLLSTRTANYLEDKNFLRALDNDNNKFYYVKIDVLDMDELPIQSIVGRAQSGCSINIDGNSSMRRTCNISVIAEESENDLTDVNNIFSINKRISVQEGIENHINSGYDDIIWFPLGIFVINQPSISHTTGGCIINLTCKDKMCLLNGENGGNLPTSITFHEYNQIIGERACSGDPAQIKDLDPNNYTIYSYTESGVKKYKSQSKEYGQVQEANNSAVGSIVAEPNLIYDIIQTLVCNYGGEALSKIFINDVPLTIKQIVRQVGNSNLYYNTATGQYTTDANLVAESIKNSANTQITFEYNEDIGYEYTDFTYPGTLISNIGDNVCSVLDNIKNTLGNYEYFYDVKGNFIFQEVKNNLNNSYNAVTAYRLDGSDTSYENPDYAGSDVSSRKIHVASYDLSILDGTNYEVDFYNNPKSVYTFSEGNGLITSFSNSPNYAAIKNDFHIWGKASDGYAIHYHLAIKEKPIITSHEGIVFIKKDDRYTGQIRLANADEIGKTYTPNDQRAELYIQGLEAQKEQKRPDVYQQELLDLFDSIYEFCYYDKNDSPVFEGRFKADMVIKPNTLKYFFDYIEPVNKLFDCSVNLLGTKIMSYQQDKIKRLYNCDIPDNIIINIDMDKNAREEIITRCNNEGQKCTNVLSKIYKKMSIGTIGYTSQEVARDLLYQYTNYNESITLQSIPIYYLDVNSRVSVYDQISGINGDYIIKSISLPLEAGGTMSISATRALERI